MSARYLSFTVLTLAKKLKIIDSARLVKIIKLKSRNLRIIRRVHLNTNKLKQMVNIVRLKKLKNPLSLICKN